MVAVDLLLGRQPGEPRPDVVLSIVDASNLDRHLYLTTQLMELGEPVVLAVNMVDVAEAQGVRIDVDALARATGLPVVPIQAHRGVGLDRLKSALVAAAKAGRPPDPITLPAALETEVKALAAELNGGVPSFLVHRLVLDVGGSIEQWLTATHGDSLGRHVAAARSRLAAAGHAVPGSEARARYGWVRGVLAKSVTRPAERLVTWTDRIDRVLTHRVWGSLFFFAVMFVVFQSMFIIADPLMGGIEEGTGWLAAAVHDGMAPGPLRSLIAEGAIPGVGGVLVFLPQILTLFAFVAVLESCGYMARAAYLMDRVMSRCGLNGKSFIPLLSSVACAVPGVMAARVIENRRDRIATIVVAPLMSCSARLPVYALLIAAFLTDGFAWWVPGLTLFGMYMIGFVVAPLVALVLKRTLLRGETPLFVMELPAYRLPSIQGVVRRMIEAGGAFVRRAGTLILASMVVVWACLYFPTADPSGGQLPGPGRGRGGGGGRRNREPAQRRMEVAQRPRPGRARPGAGVPPARLGLEDRHGDARQLPGPRSDRRHARDHLRQGRGRRRGRGPDEELGATVRADWAGDAVRGRYQVPVAVSIMVFFALCSQCASTLAVIYRETRSWTWPVFTFVYMTVLAYIGALVTFQLGRVIVDAVAS